MAAEAWSKEQDANGEYDNDDDEDDGDGGPGGEGEVEGEDSDKEDIFGNVVDNEDVRKAALDDMEKAANEMEVPEGGNMAADNANPVEGNTSVDKAVEP